MVALPAVLEIWKWVYPELELVMLALPALAVL
jgi:hypothetical protein